MASPEDDLLEPSGWQAAALPNPFMVSNSAGVSGPVDDLFFSIAINDAIASTHSGASASPSLLTPSASGPGAHRKLRGVALLGAVFDELSAQLGEEFSTAELMNAAQQLIDASKADYVAIPYKDPGDRAGYFSWDLVRAFANAWRVTEAEIYKMEHCDLDEFSAETLARARQLQQGWQEPVWEF